MIVDVESSPRVTLAVVSLGTPARLRDCIESLVHHQSKHPFAVVNVVNPAGPLTTDATWDMPDVVTVVHPAANLGWAGGLHAARRATSSEFLVWIQEDMHVLDGWLDALVDAADENQDVSAFGSRAVDEAGNPAGFSAGLASPAFAVREWNDTDTVATSVPTELFRADWITSKGLLTRVAAWDEVGGANPAMFPLNHVDKDYCTHLRAHGHSVALVPDARLVHLGSQSAPSSFRHFLLDWQEPDFNARWGGVVAALTTGAKPPVDHNCKEWFPGTTQHDDPVREVIRVCGEVATTMIVAYSKWAAKDTRRQLERLDDAHRAELEGLRRSTSWRVTAPLRAVGGALHWVASGRRE